MVSVNYSEQNRLLKFEDISVSWTVVSYNSTLKYRDAGGLERIRKPYLQRRLPHLFPRNYKPDHVAYPHILIKVYM